MELAVDVEAEDEEDAGAADETETELEESSVSLDELSVVSAPNYSLKAMSETALRRAPTGIIRVCSPGTCRATGR